LSVQDEDFRQEKGGIRMKRNPWLTHAASFAAGALLVIAIGAGQRALDAIRTGAQPAAEWPAQNSGAATAGRMSPEALSPVNHQSSRPAVVKRASQLNGLGSSVPFIKVGESLPAEFISQIRENRGATGERFVQEHNELMAQPVDNWSQDMEKAISSYLGQFEERQYVQANIICRVSRCEFIIGRTEYRPSADGKDLAGSDGRALQGLLSQRWFRDSLHVDGSFTVGGGSSYHIYSFKKGPSEAWLNYLRKQSSSPGAP
jgi:hypothetical protein